MTLLGWTKTAICEGVNRMRARESKAVTPSNSSLPSDALASILLLLTRVSILPFSSVGQVKNYHIERLTLADLTFIMGSGSLDRKSRRVSSNPHLGFYLPVALQDADLLEAVIAFFYSWRRTRIEGATDPAASSFYLRHRGRAVAGLRKRISSPNEKILASEESILT
jgi:hypothetical protein